MQQRGHDLIVLTTKRKGYPSIEVVDDIKIYRAGYNTLLDRLYDLRGSNNRRNEVHSMSRGKHLFSGLTETIVNVLWRNRYWPDGSQLFIKPGIDAGQKVIAKEKITHVITVGLPFSSHLIGRELKTNNPELHWHMDIQDPFSYSKEFRVNNYNKYKNRNIREERQAFSIANSITLTNDVADEKYANLFPEYSDKLSVIPPLFSLKKEAKYEVIPDRYKIHLGYAGSFYEGVRSPALFLAFFEELNKAQPELIDKIQIHFFGQIDPGSYELFKRYPSIKPYFIFHGFLSREQAINGLEQMDVIINFGNTTDYHLPSKVVDYLYLDKPLLNWITRPDDSTSEFLKTKDVELCNIDIAKLGQEQAESSFRKFVFQTRDVSKSNIEKVSDYLPGKIAQQYLDILAD